MSEGEYPRSARLHQTPTYGQHMIPFSILDLAPIRQGANAADAFEQMRTQAQHAEKLGYHRYWIAEHHNMGGVGSSATSVLIGHVAAATQTIRVGSGGVRARPGLRRRRRVWTSW